MLAQSDQICFNIPFSVSVMTLLNKYSLINHLPIDIEVISTSKSGTCLQQKPLVVHCNKPSVPLHFDDNKGFIRLRPKEMGKSILMVVGLSNNVFVFIAA